MFKQKITFKKNSPIYIENYWNYGILLLYNILVLHIRF